MPRLFLVAALAFAAGVPRFLTVFLVPNPDGDPYSYFQVIEQQRAALASGAFRPKDLFGFWLPLYQFVSALLSLLVDHPVYVSKVISAICGIGVCILVFQITLGLTERRGVALLAFALVAFNPLHILYSGFTGPDIPHAFLVLLAFSSVMKRRWMFAAVFAMLAGLMRVESWMLIALIPALQYLFERRVSFAAIGIMLLAPALWLYICWTATGNPLEYFVRRGVYINQTLAEYPELTHFSRQRLRLNLERMATPISYAVLIGNIAGLAFGIWRHRWLRFSGLSRSSLMALSLSAFYFSYLSFLILSFLTNNQPDLWERYGLIMFTLGLPLLAWSYLEIVDWKSILKAPVVAAVAIAFLWQVYCQVPYYSAFREQGVPRQIIANNLRDLYLAKPGIGVFSDDPGVPVLSGVPPEATYCSQQAPDDPDSFLSYLGERGIAYIVVDDDRDSTPLRLFPELGRGISNNSFKLIAPFTPKDWHGRVWLYEFTRNN